MGILSALFGSWSNENEHANDFTEAVGTWRRYARQSLLEYAGTLQGQRVAIKHQARFEGTREAALIIGAGLADFGATVVSSEEPFDWEIHISRYSREEALYKILDSSGNTVGSGVFHHELIVYQTVKAFSEHCLAHRTK